MRTTLGKKIAELRREKGITQEEMAERLGVSPQAVSKWENDTCCPDIMLLPKIAEMVGITVDELLSNEPKKEAMMLPQEQRKNPDDLAAGAQRDGQSDHGEQFSRGLFGCGRGGSEPGSAAAGSGSSAPESDPAGKNRRTAQGQSARAVSPIYAAHTAGVETV